MGPYGHSDPSLFPFATTNATFNTTYILWIFRKNFANSLINNLYST